MGAVAGGVYGVVTRVVVAGTWLEAALRIVMGPRLRPAAAVGDHRGAEIMFHSVAIALILLSWPYYITVAVFAEATLNPLIKVMNLVSLLMLPAIINFEIDDDNLRFLVAGVSLLVLAGAVVWSSRKTEGMMAPEPGPAARAGVRGADVRSLMLAALLAIGP